jgi:hypothetical protein
VINVCDFVVKEVLEFKRPNNHEMSFIDLQKQFVGAETALLRPTTLSIASFCPSIIKQLRFL